MKKYYNKQGQWVALSFPNAAGSYTFKTGIEVKSVPSPTGMGYIMPAFIDYYMTTVTKEQLKKIEKDNEYVIVEE